MASRQKLCPRWDILSRGIFLRTKSIGQLFHFFNKMNNSSCLRNSGRRFPQCQCVKPFENEASFRWRIGLRKWLAQPLTCYSREWHCTSSEWKHEPCIISFELLAHVLLILISARSDASEWRILKGLNDSNENARNDVVKNDVFFQSHGKWFMILHKLDMLNGIDVKVNIRLHLPREFHSSEMFLENRFDSVVKWPISKF